MCATQSLIYRKREEQDPHQGGRTGTHKRGKIEGEGPQRKKRNGASEGDARGRGGVGSGKKKGEA